MDIFKFDDWPLNEDQQPAFALHNFGFFVAMDTWLHANPSSMVRFRWYRNDKGYLMLEPCDGSPEDLKQVTKIWEENYLPFPMT